MTDNVTLPGTGQVVETRSQTDGSERQVISLGSNENAALIAALNRIANPVWFEPSIGAMRVLIQSNATNGAVSISAGTLSTVSAVTSVNQLGGVAANSVVGDTSLIAWASALRGRIT
jgi:hypothetical protein